MPEEFRLQKFSGDCGTIYRDKGIFPSFAQVVDRPREEFFSRTTFTQQEDRCLRGRYLLDFLGNFLNAGTLSDYFRDAEPGGYFIL
jgi:hypothetical protein